MSEPKKPFSNSRTILFVVVICFVCALILSALASILREKQQNAVKLYQSKQLLIAAQLLSYDGEFTMPDGSDAIFQDGKLTPGPKTKASSKDILRAFDAYVYPRLTNSSGQVYTFNDAGIDEETYIKDHAKLGYASLPDKLVYLIYYDGKPPASPLPADAYVIPINGFGLWDAIYGYLCLAKDANTILGNTWYEQAETPGLGGDIALPKWQNQFKGKMIFQKNADGTTDFGRAPLGIIIVKSTVQDVYGNSPKAESAVDGVSGATITMQGVMESFSKTLEQYRPFLLKAHSVRGAR